MSRQRPRPSTFSAVICVLATVLTATPGLADELSIRDGSQPGGGFAAAISAHGDLNNDSRFEIAVGSPGFDGVAGVDAGKVKVFNGAGGTLFEIEGENAGDRFGSSVRVTTGLLIVGAPLYNGTFTESGKVYVFDATGSLLTSFEGDLPFVNLGQAVTASDMDGDGTPDIIMGAPLYDTPNGPQSGRVYAYSGSSPYSLIHAIDGESAGDAFGAALAPGGLIDGDSKHDLIVGAPLYNGPGGGNAGRAYAISGDDGGVLATFDGVDGGDQFGSAVAGGANLAGDASVDVVVASANHDGAGTARGHVRVYSGDGTFLYELNGEKNGNEFGTSIDVVDDLDGDGATDLLVGAPGFDGPLGNDVGKAYAFSGLTAATLLIYVGNSAGEALGTTVSSAGDIDTDLAPDMAFGAPSFDATAGAADGRLYLISGDPFQHCNQGFVNRGAGTIDDITDVLFLNGATGGSNRTVSVRQGRLVWGAILAPPAGGNGKFVVHANAATPDYTTLSILPKSIGTGCFPFLLAQGAAFDANWNSIGKENKVGASQYFDGSSIPDPASADTVFLSLFDGDLVHLSAGTEVVFQGLIIDPAATSPAGASLTNAVKLLVTP